MERYRLVEAVTTPTVVDICWTAKSGAKVYGHTRLVPGETYEMPEGDTLLRESLIGATEKVQYTKSYEELLKSYGVKYDIVPPTCHCRKVPSIVFHCVEVYEA